MTRHVAHLLLALLLAPASAVAGAPPSNAKPAPRGSVVSRAIEALTQANAAGKWTVLVPTRPGLAAQVVAGLKRQAMRTFNRTAKELAIVPFPSVSNEGLRQVLDRAEADALYLPGTRDARRLLQRPGATDTTWDETQLALQATKTAAALRTADPARRPAVFLDGRRLTPPEALGPAKAPQKMGVVTNPDRRPVASIQKGAKYVRFVGANGQVLARLDSAHLAQLLENVGVQSEQDLAGLVPVRILTTGQLHFVDPKLLPEVDEALSGLRGAMEAARFKSYRRGLRRAEAAGKNEVDAEKAAKAEKDNLVFVYASSFISGGKPADGATNRDIARFVSDEVLTRNARTIFGTSNVFVINPAAVEANLESARSGSDYMYFWSEFLLGKKGGEGIQIFHFTGPRMVRGYFESRGKPIPEHLRDRGLANSVGMRQEWNAAVLRNSLQGVNGNMVHIFYDGQPMPMAAHNYIQVPTFKSAGWHKRDKREALPDSPVTDARAVSRLVLDLEVERYGSTKPAQAPQNARERENAELDAAFDEVARVRAGVGPAPSRATRDALRLVTRDATKILGRVRPTIAALTKDLNASLAAKKIDPAYRLNVALARRLGRALGVDVDQALGQQAATELAEREARLAKAVAEAKPVTDEDLYRVKMIGNTMGIATPTADRILAGGSPGGVAMRLRSGENWVETNVSLVGKIFERTFEIQNALDQAAREGKQRLYLSVPISSDDVKMNQEIAKRAEAILYREAPELLGVGNDQLYIVNPAGYQEFHADARGKHFMRVWQWVLSGNEAGNFEHVNFLGNAWTGRLYREIAGAQANPPRPAHKVDVPLAYAAKGVMESKGGRDEHNLFEKENDHRRRMGKPEVQVYEDGRILPYGTRNAHVRATTYEKRGEVVEPTPAPPAAR